MRNISFVIAFVLTVATVSLASAQRLHAILVADTQSNIGNSVRADIQNMRKVLETGLPYGRLHVIELTGNEVTKNRITSTLRNLSIANDDAVLLFYAGHGAFDRQRGHYLDLTNSQPLYRSEVIDAITQPYTPRFWAVITDCCAAIPPIAMAPMLVPSERKTLLSYLFLETTGRLDVTSCRPEQVALGLDPPVGGLFTWSLCGVLNENATRRINWDEVFRLTRAGTASLAEDLLAEDPNPYVHDGIEQRTQIPYSFRTMYGREVNGLRFGIHHDGTLLTSVDSGSPAAQAGLRSGMRILRVNGKRIGGTNQLMTAVNFSPRNAVLEVQSNTGTRTMNVRLAY